ncbi:MAG: DUF302 domain-containing protein [Candidatus Cybelea sp.]|jgi:uncharacterized protein (DUF302 family)
MPVTATRKTNLIEHVTIESGKPFDEARAALEGAVPPLDQKMWEFVRAGDADGLKKQLDAGPELSILSSRDHGALLQVAGPPRRAMQYDIGNPLTATKMTRHVLAAGLYAPIRVILYEAEDGRTRFEYDRPLSTFGQFGDEAVTAVATALDAALERTLRDAAA